MLTMTVMMMMADGWLVSPTINDDAVHQNCSVDVPGTRSLPRCVKPFSPLPVVLVPRRDLISSQAQLQALGASILALAGEGGGVGVKP